MRSRSGRLALWAALVAVVAVLGAALASASFSQGFLTTFGVQLLQTFDNPDPDRADHFGAAVSFSVNRPVIGAPGDDADGRNAGAAFVFQGSTLMNLTSSSPNAGDRFGFSVAGVGSFGNLIAVGSPALRAPGEVEIFGGPNATSISTLRSPAADADFFGYSVAPGPSFITPTTVLVGAPENSTDSGAAYLFDAFTGTLRFQFPNPAAVSGDFFGAAVGSLDSLIVVGAPRDDPGGVRDAGSAYVLAPNGFIVDVLESPNLTPVAEFGAAIATDPVRNLTLVGAPGDSTAGPRAGAAYLFAGGGSTNQTLRNETFLNPFPDRTDGFGSSVAFIGQDAVAIGAPLDDVGTRNAGAIYLFDVRTGSFLLTIENPAPERGGLFGSSVASSPFFTSGSLFLTGAPGNSSVARQAGAAYLYFVQPLINSSG